MIPILYATDEQDFTSNGLGRLADCRKFEVTEERNGIYECEFEYPVTGPLFSELKYGYYVCATHDDSKTPQPFEIYSKEATLDGWATFRAWHISYQLNDIIVQPFTASGIADAISKIAPNEITPGKFTFWTDKITSGDFSLNIPKPARALLGGSEGSLLDVFGKGDYEFDMYSVKLYANRGADRGVSIRYGKNLTKLEQELQGGNVVNGVVPYWTSTDGDVVWVNFPIYGGAISYPTRLQTQALEVLQTHVPADIYAQYANLKVQALDLSSEFETAPTPDELATKARQIMNGSTAYQLEENLSIDFVPLWQTDEYKSVAALQRAYLCDTVHVFYEKLGVNVSAKVIKVVYDTLRERYTAMELGEPKTTLAQQIKQTVTDGVMAQVRRTFPDRSAMQAAIEYATKLIEGGMGGYVIIEPDENGYPEEILIMDTPDKMTAVNVWRWNQGGLGHSSTGYNGPFSDIALTADGKINASMITTGALDAGIITTGTLDANRIAAGSIALTQLDSSAQNTINNANYREQIIYKSAQAGTTSMAGTNTWVTASGNTQGAWTTRRPEYSTSYPVLFVAVQRQDVANSSGTTCTCTTPAIDLTTTVIDGGNIITGTVTANQIASGTITSTQLAAAVNTDISDALTNASAAQTTANGANYREQVIYKSIATGGTAPGQNTTWVTDATGAQGIWTTRRPEYSSSYPVLYVALQRQTVLQYNGGSGTGCSCITPYIDQTTTVIDGGHILTGIIDADLIRAGKIQDVNGDNSWDLDTGDFITKKGTLGQFNIDGTGLHVGSHAAGQTGASVYPTVVWLTGLAADGSGLTTENQMRAGQVFLLIERNNTMENALVYDVHLDNDGYPYAEFRVGESGRITMTLLDHANANNAYDITMASLQVISKLSCLGPVSISGDTTINSHDLYIAGGGVYASGPVKSNGNFVLEIH